MLVTRDAIEAIKSISDAEVDGVRIAAASPAQNGRGPALALEPASAPGPSDTVIDAEGAHIYVDVDAVAALDGKVLDADREPDGIRFALFDAA